MSSCVQGLGRGASLFASVAALLVAVLTPLSVLSEGIVRWVDDQGHVHYSDHAPAGHTPVSSVTSAPPPSAPATPAESQSQGNSGGNGGSNSGGPTEADLATQWELSHRAEQAQKNQASQRQAMADSQKAMKDKVDQAVIAHCKADHENYCNQGADSIRQHEKWQLMSQCADMHNQYGAPPPACRNINGTNN
jgi:hypothetical protein